MMKTGASLPGVVAEKLRALMSGMIDAIQTVIQARMVDCCPRALIQAVMLVEGRLILMLGAKMVLIPQVRGSAKVLGTEVLGTEVLGTEVLGTEMLSGT